MKKIWKLHSEFADAKIRIVLLIHICFTYVHICHACTCASRILYREKQYFLLCFLLLLPFLSFYQRHHSYVPKGNTTSNSRRFNIVIAPIRRSPNFDKFSRYFHVLYRSNSLIEDSTLFPCTFFYVISMVEKSTLFPSTSLM